MIGRYASAPARPIGSDKWLVTFEVDDVSQYDELKDKELSIEVKRYRKKRSLDANAYCWVLCSEIARVLDCTKDEVYEAMIQSYAPFDRRGDDGYITVTMLSIVPVDKLGGHWRAISQHEEFTSYMRLVGSSEMDSEQMAHFLNGIVSEAKELGIETETPEELERMAKLWKV